MSTRIVQMTLKKTITEYIWILDSTWNIWENMQSLLIIQYECAVKHISNVLSAQYLKSILQARQFVFLSNVCIWKLCWLAVALSGLMLDLKVNKNEWEELSGQDRSFMDEMSLIVLMLNSLDWGKTEQLFYLWTVSELNFQESYRIAIHILLI